MTALTLTPRALREQRTFRLLLDCMARPGTIGRLPEHPHPGPHGAAIAALEALVDHEVTFCVFPERSEVSEAVLRQTGSRLASLEEADYVLCDALTLPQALLHTKDGPPDYPDRGATLVCLVEGISADGGPGAPLNLSGPGIRDTATVWIDGFEAAAREAFQERNAAPPLGADLVLVTPSGEICCLGRYTRLSGEDTGHGT